MQAKSRTLPKDRASQARRALRRPLLGLLVVLGVAGCQRDDVRHYRVPRQGVGTGGAVPVAAPAAPPAMDPSAVPPPPAVEGGLSWTLPKGWTESRAGGMRYATLVPGTPGKLDVSVVVLPGPAGGEVANVNRWRGQIGLKPVDEAELAKGRRELRSPAGTVALFDFTSEGATKSRMVAGILMARGNSWFVKMVGDAGPVGTARADFIRLLESLRLAP
jgi:hypothetical protein